MSMQPKRESSRLGAGILLAALSVAGFAADDKMALDLSFDEGAGGKTANAAAPLDLGLLKQDPEWVAGYRGKALKFTKAGQHVRVFSQIKLPLEAFTFECWINPEQIPGIRSIFIGPFSQTFRHGFDICLKDGHPMLRYGAEKRPGNILVADSMESKLAPGVFSHLAVVYDKQHVKMFVNGNLVLDKELDAPIAFQGAEAGVLVVNPYTGPAGVILDEVKFYARALTSDEVQLHGGKSFSFAMAPAKINAGQAPAKKWYFCYDHTMPIKPIDLDRCIGFTGKPYDRFTASEVKSVLFDIKNLTDTDAKARLCVRIEDWRNQVVKSEDVDVMVPAKGATRRELSLETGSNGCFLLILEVFKGGEKLFGSNKPYAVTVDPDKDPAGQDSPFGRHMHDGLWNSRVMPDIASSSVRLWVQTVCWAQLEREQGKFDWEASDYVVNACFESGQKILFTLAYTPAWASSAPDSAKKAPWHVIYRHPPRDIKDWENFVRQVVRRYKDKVKWWEIWNEPDSGYFCGTPEEYLALLKSAYMVLKEEDPSCKVVGISGTSLWYDFTRKIFELGGAKYMDILSVHFYLNNPPEKCGNLLPWIKAAKELVKSTGKAMPVWDTESGYASPLRGDDGRMIDVPPGTMQELPCFSGHQKWKTFGERLTAAYSVRQRILQVANGVEKFFLFDQFYMPKGVYPLCLVAHQAMVKYIGDRKFARNIPLGEESLHGYLFADKNNVAVLWSAGAESDILLDCQANKVQLVDFMGNSREVNSEKPIKITLNDYPVYIVGCGRDIKLAGQPFDFRAETKATVGAKFAVNISNTGTNNAVFSARLLDAQYKPLHGSESNEIQAGMGKEFSLMVPAGTPEGDAFVMAQMKAENTRPFARTLPVRIVNPPWPVFKIGEGKIVVDGNLEDWAGSEKMFLNREEQVKFGRKNPAFIGVPSWEGPDDLSAVMAARWTDKGLFLAFDVTDDSIAPSSDAKTYFSGDCIELFLDLRNKENLGKASGGDGVYHLLLVPGKAAGDKTACVAAPSVGVHRGYARLLPAAGPAGEKSLWDLFSRDASDPKIIVSGRRTLRGYVVEIFIPLLPELSSAETFADGRIIGFDVALDDADAGIKDGKRKTQAIYNGTEANHRDASRFATLRLVVEKAGRK